MPTKQLHYLLLKSHKSCYETQKIAWYVADKQQNLLS